MKRFLAYLLLGLSLTLAGAAEPEKSVVQVMTFSQSPDWIAPWRFSQVGRGTGTGFLIKGKKIMTNAHVIGWGKQILVKRYQDPRPYRARVAFVSHECDLALLEVEEESFFKGMQALEIGELPEVRSSVTTMGYPAGGEQISFTRGVVSRIEMQGYVHMGNRVFLTVQTDAAINPGNSGGPVIQDDKVVGVAFQGTPGLENTGFFIPPPIINHFLKDIEDGKYDGFPKAGISLMPMQNPAFRKLLKLPDDDIGSRVDDILPGAVSEKVLKVDDVLLEVNGYSVASDGTILYKGNRVSVSVAFQEPQNGESIPVKIWRNGKEISARLDMRVNNDDLPTGNQYDVLPRYYVYGGMVFTPLSMDFMRRLPRGGSTAAMLYELTYRRREKPETVREEPIVLSTIMAHPVNANIQVRGGALVDRINGIKINKLEDVIRAFQEGKTEQHIIEFLPRGGFECLERKDADAANADILKTYNIASDRRL
jgi:S1-C subfamily serine protease